MKKIIIIVVFTISYFGFSQNEISGNSTFWVSYQLGYKKFLTSESTQNVNTTLIVTSQGSLFTFEGMMNFDKIQQVRELTTADALINISPFYFLVKSDGDSTEHFETIGGDSYRFKENLNHDWKLINQDTIISGYPCKKATVNYSGRDWSAWYCPEVPITVGPYKFNGLPGLIMNIKDSEGVFNFMFSEIKKEKVVPDYNIENYFAKDGRKPFGEIDIHKFYKIRKKFSELTLNEKFNYSNRDQEVKGQLVVQGISGEQIRQNAKPKPKNFIERFE